MIKNKWQIYSRLVAGIIALSIVFYTGAFALAQVNGTTTNATSTDTTSTNATSTNTTSTNATSTNATSTMPTNNATTTNATTTSSTDNSNNGTGSTDSNNLDLSALISDLQALQSQIDVLETKMQDVWADINSLNGGNGSSTNATSTSNNNGNSGGSNSGNNNGGNSNNGGMSSNATINPMRVTIGRGGTMDWNGRDFGREQSVQVMINGRVVANAHADGGGNFSTGSVKLDLNPGTYNVNFTDNNGGYVTSVLDVM